MKAPWFIYLCLGAILSSLLHELFISVPFTSTSSLVFRPWIRPVNDVVTNQYDNSDNSSNNSVKLETQQQRKQPLVSPTITPPQQQQQRQQRLADGCHHVFLDVGSNIGVHGRMLLEPHLYPEKMTTTNTTKRRRKKKKQQQQKRRRQQQKEDGPKAHHHDNNIYSNNNNTHNYHSHFTTSRQFFVSQFGSEDTRIATEYCIFAFEPNPIHRTRQLELQSIYTGMGWRYHFLPAGVSDTDGYMTFYHIRRGDKELERGFTTNRGKCKSTTTGKNNNNTNDNPIVCPTEQVKVYRLSDWIDREVHGRSTTIPASNTKNNDGTFAEATTQHHSPTLPPKVVMKMDIEMGEWLVLPDLLASGVLCQNVDALLIEFHTGGRHEKEYPVHFHGVAQSQSPPSSPSHSYGDGDDDDDDNHRDITIYNNNTTTPSNSSTATATTTTMSWTLESYQEAEQLKTELMHIIHRNPNCKTLVVEGDDESYGRDGMPWPTNTHNTSSSSSS